MADINFTPAHRGTTSPIVTKDYINIIICTRLRRETRQLLKDPSVLKSQHTINAINEPVLSSYATYVRATAEIRPEFHTTRSSLWLDESRLLDTMQHGRQVKKLIKRPCTKAYRTSRSDCTKAGHLLYWKTKHRSSTDIEWHNFDGDHENLNRFIKLANNKLTFKNLRITIEQLAPRNVATFVKYLHDLYYYKHLHTTSATLKKTSQR